MSRPPVGSTGTLAELQVEPGDVVRFHHPDMGPGCHRVVARVDCDRVYMTDSVMSVVEEPYWTLISRARPDQPAHIVTHEGRDYDLTALETPFGLLPEPVQKALQSWPHGRQRYTSQLWADDNDGMFSAVTYRAKPAPVETRVQCYRGEQGVRSREHGTCIKRHDGSLDWASWEDA